MASHGVPRVSASETESKPSREKELQKIEQYKELVALVNARVAEKEYTPEVLALTSKLLQDNPEFYTIWNHRRLILQHQFAYPSSFLGSDPTPPEKEQCIFEQLSADLSFQIPILTKFPKCYWIWNHRTWLLQQSITLLPSHITVRLWTQELGLVSKMLNRDSRNFHGWDYRRYVVSQLEQLQSGIETDTTDDNKTKRSMVEDEFNYTTKMIKTNLSNFSAWHNRSQLIPRILSERDADATARRAMLNSEFELIQQAINTDPYDQSLWFYHQYLMSTLLPATPPNSAIVLNLTNYDRLSIYEREIDSIKDILEDTQDCKWIYQALLQYTPHILDVEAGNKIVTTREMREWLTSLRELDPLRKGRWDDLEKLLSL